MYVSVNADSENNRKSKCRSKTINQHMLIFIVIQTKEVYELEKELKAQE